MGSRVTMGNRNGSPSPILRPEDVSALSATSGLTEEQIREDFHNFLEEHPEGKVKPKLFRDMLTKAMPRKDASKMEKHVFRIYDSNNDGSIDFIEFMLIFHIMSAGTPEEIFAKIFRLFDINGDGTISKKEMSRLVKDMYGLIKTDDPHIGSQTEIADAAFSEMDADGDGKITLAEFVSACISHDETSISKMLALKVVDIFLDE